MASGTNHHLPPPATPLRSEHLSSSRVPLLYTRVTETTTTTSTTTTHAQATTTQTAASIQHDVTGKLVLTALGFARRSTIHGLNHFAQARGGRRKFFWFGISVIAAVGCIVNLGLLFEKYAARPVLTNVLHDYELFTFPDITVCLTNPIYYPPKSTTSYHELMKLFTAYDYDRLHHPSAQVRALPLADYLYYKRSPHYSHPAWSAIVQCFYQNTVCNFTHFQVRNIWPYGNCFTFNASLEKVGRQVQKQIRMSPFRPDLKVVLYKAQTFSELHSIDPHDTITMPSGAVVMLHEADTQANPGQSYLVDGSTQVDLKISKVQHAGDMRSCNSNVHYHEFSNVLNNESFSFLMRQHDCYNRGVQELLVNNCGCVHFSMKLPTEFIHYPLCVDKLISSRDSKNCYVAFREDPMFSKLHDFCFIDYCNHSSFSTVISQSKFPAVAERNTHKAWMKLLKEMEDKEMKYIGASDLAFYALKPQWNASQYRNYTNSSGGSGGGSGPGGITIAQALLEGRYDWVNEDFLEKNFMMLRVVPSSIYMDLVDETEEYPMSRLLSDIGGCIGLWVGASLITVFEFIDLLCDFSDANLYRGRRRAMQPVSLHADASPTALLMTNETPMNSSGHNSETTTYRLVDFKRQSPDLEADVITLV